MTKSWILVANSTKAQLFESIRPKLLNGNASLDLLEEFEHPESRLKPHELASDGHGKPRNHMSFEHTDIKQNEFETFARQLAHHLEEGRIQHKYDDLILVAAPHFHGMINKHLNQHIKDILSVSIEKDYTHLNSKELVTNIKNYL